MKTLYVFYKWKFNSTVTYDNGDDVDNDDMTHRLNFSEYNENRGSARAYTTTILRYT